MEAESTSLSLIQTLTAPTSAPFALTIMPRKIAKKGQNSQTKQAIAKTQAEPLDQACQPVLESQIDAETQVDADVHSSSVNSDAVIDTLAFTADGADAASTPDTTHTPADETKNNERDQAFHRGRAPVGSRHLHQASPSHRRWSIGCQPPGDFAQR